MAKEEQIKTSIDLTGEKEYRAACTNINSSLREIGSEMKLTTAEFADNADSVEALTAKQKLLQKQFDEQAKKAEAAEKALKKMRDNGIEPTNPAYQKMQTNLNNTKADMVKIQKEIDDTSKKLKSSKVDWESVGETVGKAGKAIGAACAAMGAAIAAAGAAFFGLAEETREARENMGKLETSFTTAGHSAEDAKNTYTELYGVLGDDGQATEAAAHLAKLTTNEKELSDWTNICTGVYATFGDSLPIEGLTEAANETAKTGSITGNLADALNWAGVSEDDFQASLDACTSEQERQALITSTLNGLYSEAADKYREVNGDIIDAQKATAEAFHAGSEQHNDQQPAAAIEGHGEPGIGHSVDIIAGAAQLHAVGSGTGGSGGQLGGRRADHGKAHPGKRAADNGDHADGADEAGQGRADGSDHAALEALGAISFG